MTALANVNLSLNQGEDFSNTWIWANASASGDPSAMTYFDFAGCAARMTVRAALDPNSTAYITLMAGSGITFVSVQAPGGPAAPTDANAFKITITAAQSLTLPNNATLYYDLFVDFGVGTHTLFLAGELVVGTTVTR